MVSGVLRSYLAQWTESKTLKGDSKRKLDREKLAKKLGHELMKTLAEGFEDVSCMRKGAVLEKGLNVFVSFVDCYKEHRCSYMYMRFLHFQMGSQIHEPHGSDLPEVPSSLTTCGEAQTARQGR
ncbi:unnamed protein product [Arabis nemorensis]|uniref:Uncharacterized protein n=1 Tax=Arabis nemorensis TaxID=586526 RepID=A0A565B0G6_9BRAS|nr:unnamed protein product [Arabis nemorensis]